MSFICARTPIKISHDMKKNSMLDEVGIDPFCHSQIDCMGEREAT